MNAQARLYGPSSTEVIATTCIALSAVAPLAALADPPIAPTSHTLESRVSLADLDLSTPEGIHAAHERLRGKAEHLCRQLADSVTASFRWDLAACVKETLANAIQQLNAPAFAVANRPRSEP
jgi:UrcA family protein